MRCANCGNENFDTLTFRHFTVHCSVCGHNTFTSTGHDTRKVRNIVIILVVAALFAVCFWTLATTPYIYLRTGGIFHHWR